MFPIHERPYDYYRFTRYGLVFLLREFAEVRILERNSYFEAIDVLYVRLLQGKVRGTRWMVTCSSCSSASGSRSPGRWASWSERMP